MNYTGIRLKTRRFFKKYKKLIFIVISLWLIILLVNIMLKSRKIELKPLTTYNPHVSVMDTSSKTPESLQDPIENLLKEYIDTCNDGNYQKAFDMLSDECKEYEFNNDVRLFMKHVLTKMPTPKKYGIQNYSNVSTPIGNLYIYEIKYVDDILATGLTNSQYAFTSEKIAFYKDKDGKLNMSVGSYLFHTDVKSISENEYLKIDVIDRAFKYSTEEYKVKFTNRSNYTIVISDGNGKNECELKLSQETRRRIDDKEIVLGPGESTTEEFEFEKFVDDGDSSQGILFGSIRVMEKYSGNVEDENVIQNEIDNAITKFSMSISL